MGAYIDWVGAIARARMEYTLPAQQRRKQNIPGSTGRSNERTAAAERAAGRTKDCTLVAMAASATTSASRRRPRLQMLRGDLLLLLDMA